MDFLEKQYRIQDLDLLKTELSKIGRKKEEAAKNAKKEGHCAIDTKRRVVQAKGESTRNHWMYSSRNDMAETAEGRGGGCSIKWPLGYLPILISLWLFET